MKQRSVMKPTMNAKDIPVLLKHYSKKDSGTILETSSIKFMRCTEPSKYICTYGILYLSHGITPIVTWNIVKRVSSKTSAN